MKYLNPWSTVSENNLVYFIHDGRVIEELYGCKLVYNKKIESYDYVFKGVCFMQVKTAPEAKTAEDVMMCFAIKLRGYYPAKKYTYLQHKIDSAVATYTRAKEILNNAR